MKIFEFTDFLYCYVAIIVTFTLEDAKKHPKYKECNLSECTMIEHNIEENLFIEGGGNG